jgi:hypothetical protein
LGLKDGMCALALSIVDNDEYSDNDFAFGTPLFRQYCVAFDLEKNLVQFYNHLN